MAIVAFHSYHGGYGIIKRADGTCCAYSDSEMLDCPHIGFGAAVDQGKTFNLKTIRKRIDEVIAERAKRIEWVKEFAQTQKNPKWVEGYLMSSCDPSNRRGHGNRGHHTEAEMYDIWDNGGEYLIRYGMGFHLTSKIKYFYRRYLIEQGYIEVQ